jgi:hypothetical protein
VATELWINPNVIAAVESRASKKRAATLRER